MSTTIAERFRLERLLGVGGMGAVYEAHDPWTDRRVALKLLHRDEAASNERSDERFFREARLVAKLDHPHIVRLFDIGRAEDGALYLVQELLDGQDLRRALRSKGRLSAQHTLEVLIAVCDAIAHAHAHGVVHRDLKPENIFVQRTKSDRLVAKVIDFGIARTVSRDQRLTPTGHVFGTPSYMAPEQADGHSPVARSWDLWALAIIAYECLTGANPYARDNVLATLSALLKDPAPSIASQRDGLPPALCAAIDRALDRSIENRFADALSLRDALIEAGSLSAAPWVSALVERSLDERDERASSEPRATHEQLASDGSMPTAAPTAKTAKTEGTEDLPPAPRAQTEATIDAPAHEQTVSTDTAFEVALSADELAALGLAKKPRARRGAIVATVTLVSAGAIGLAWTRDEPRTPVAHGAVATQRTPPWSVEDSGAAVVSSVEARPPRVEAASPRAQSAVEPTNATRRTSSESPRRTSESRAISTTATQPHPAVEAPAQSDRSPRTNPFTDDDTSTPIRRYP